MTPTAPGPAFRSATALSTPPLIATAVRSALGAAPDGRADRVRERVGRERVAADRSCLEQGQAGELPVEPGRVGADDPLPVDPEPNGGPVPAARGVSEELDHAASVASPLVRTGTTPERAFDASAAPLHHP